jgi:deoxycytidylate deaminase
VIVTANNIACREVQAEAHAEARLVRKLNHGSDIYVARVLRDGTVATARPCPKCQKAMRNRGINRVFYTISDSEWGCLQL